MTRILVVDDDELNRKILRDIFEDAHYDVIEASDGQKGLAILEQEPDIQLILLDRMMPNMNGMEFMQHFTARPEWQNKAVIMQTAAGQPKEVIEGSASGVYYYLTKPFDDVIVMTIVRAALSEIEARQNAAK